LQNSRNTIEDAKLYALSIELKILIATLQRRQYDEIFNIQRPAQALADKPHDSGYMTVKDAMTLIVESWRDVGEGAKPVIRDRFRHCKIQSEVYDDEIGQEDLVDEGAMTQLQTVTGRPHHTSPMNISTLLNDESIQVQLGEDIMHDEVEKMTLVQSRHVVDDEHTESDNDGDSSKALKVPVSEAAATLESLKLFFLWQEGDYLTTLTPSPQDQGRCSTLFEIALLSRVISTTSSHSPGTTREKACNKKNQRPSSSQPLRRLMQHHPALLLLPTF